MCSISEIKSGYWKSKLGDIPDDWGQGRLDDLTAKIGDGIHTTPKYVKESEYYFINGNNLVNGKIVINKGTKCVSYEEYLKHQKILNRRTILISINGTIGNIALYNNEKVILGKSAAYINCSDQINELYLYYLLQTSRVQRYFENELTGSTIRNLSLKSIRNTPIPLPLYDEQQKIALILSTWDKAIEKTEQLIQAKTQLKKGLMQQLLTGDKRLNGYKKEWDIVKLNSVCKISKGEQLNKLKLNKEDEYPSYSGGMEPSGYTKKWNTEANTITISEGGNSCGFVNFITSRFWCGGHCYALLSIKSHTSKSYLYQCLKYNEPQIMRLRVGSGLPNVQKKDIEAFKIKLPEIKEQESIANILDCADSEIRLLNQYLDQLIEQKKGLMQKLLTGEVRTKID